MSPFNFNNLYTRSFRVIWCLMMLCWCALSLFCSLFFFQKSRRARPTTPHIIYTDSRQRDERAACAASPFFSLFSLLRPLALSVVRICFAWLIDTWYYQFEMFGNNFIIYSWPLYLISMVYHFVLFFNFDYWILKNTVASILCICKYIQLFQA